MNQNLKPKILTIIPARGGSKGIPRKNIKLLKGKPLIYYTIKESLKSDLLDKIIVSTEDVEIAAIAREYGTEVVDRPVELANDDTSSVDVVIQALDYLESRNGIEFNYVLLLQPTSPFRLVEDIDSAIRLALEGNADSVIGVSEALSHPYLTMRIKDSDGTVENFMQKPEGYPRRQDLPPAYVVNGAIYLTRREVLIKEKTFFPDHTLGFVMPQERSMDIDTLWDFHLAEMIMESPCDTEMP